MLFLKIDLHTSFLTTSGINLMYSILMYTYANKQAFSGHLPFTYANLIYVNFIYVSVTHVKHNTMFVKIIIFTVVNNYIQRYWFFLGLFHFFF